jgi:hypothetical protein
VSLPVAALVLVVALAVGGYSVYRAFRADRRQRAMPAVAARAGLEFSDVDPFNSAVVAFPLFRQGVDRRVANLMGRAADRTDGRAPVARVFDFSFMDRPRGGGVDAEVWHDFSCALAQHNGEWPTIRVARENVVERAFQKLGLPDIDFESEEFNREFVVQCADRRFASALIDARMIDFLVSTGGQVSFETKGRFLLVTSDPVEADVMPGLLQVAEEFLRLVPPVVRELYPSFPDGAGTEVFPVAPVVEPPPRLGVGGGLLGGFDDVPSPFEFAPPSHLRDPEPDAWDPTPGVDHDLDGHPVAPVAEDPWHDHPLRGEGRPGGAP